jgi:type VI secretion system protein
MSRIGAGHGPARGEDSNESILAHLRVLLNTRKGAAVTTPGFGIVDFNDFVHLFPVNLHLLQASIRATILEFEPRLRNVLVRYLPDEDPLVIRFEITAQPAKEGARTLLRFRTQLTPGGKIDVW